MTQNEYAGCRTITFHFTTKDGQTKSVTQNVRGDRSYEQYESNAIGAMIREGFEITTGWTHTTS